jgi:hypothetical protein
MFENVWAEVLPCLAVAVLFVFAVLWPRQK